MNISSFLPSATFQITPLMIPAIVLVIGGIIAVAAILAHHFRQKAWYDVVRLSIEKGQPLPQFPVPGPGSAASWPSPCVPSSQVRTPRHDLRSALILIAVSAGLYLGLSDLHVEGIRTFPAFSLIPGCIGVALLINALIGALFPSKRVDAADPSLKP